MKILPIRLETATRKLNFIQTKKQNSTSNNLILPNNLYFTGFVSNSKALEYKKIKSALFQQKPQINGVGFYGPDSIGKDKAFNDFVDDLRTHDYEVVKIPEFYQAPQADIAEAIIKAQQEAQDRYSLTRKKTALIVKGIDDENLISNYKNIFAALKEFENSKEKGYIWVWSAENKNKIDKGLIRRTDSFIFAKPNSEDSRQTWMNYFSMINDLPQSTYRTNLLIEATNLMPKIFPIKISPLLEQQFGNLATSDINIATHTGVFDSLEDYQQGISQFLNNDMLSNLSFDELDSIRIKDKSLLDFWLEQSGEDSEKYTPRLKEKWFEQISKDGNKMSELIALTLDKLQDENNLIQSARTSYKDILDNEDNLSFEQKEILTKQLDSKLFFLVVTNQLKSDDTIKIQLNTLDTLRQLSGEKEKIRQNAESEIFKPARDITVFDGDNQDDLDVVSYVISLLQQKIAISDEIEKRELEVLLDAFENTKNSGNEKDFRLIWAKLVDIAQEYFNSEILDDITDKNIELLYSINQKASDADSQIVKKLMQNKKLSIEQREFVARYKDNREFRLMISNPNVKVDEAIEELVLFESSNRNLIQQSGLDFDDSDFEKLMSDKFNKINGDNKDIKIQTDRIIGKIDEFQNEFSLYADKTVSLQALELQELSISNQYLKSISENVDEVKQYSKALLRTQLVKLEKDKNYKNIVSEITKLLPDDEQIDLVDFLARVDKLAKKEKNDNRRKAIMKAGLIIAGTAVFGAGVYYFGPAVVAHLASALPIANTTSVMTSAIGATNIAKKLGNSQVLAFSGRSVKQIMSEIDHIQKEINFNSEMANKHPNQSLYGSRIDDLQKRLKRLYDELKNAIK